MRKADPGQLTFVFADDPIGRKEPEPEKLLEGKDYLRHIAKGEEARGPAAAVVDTSRLLERAASEPNMARALLNVARNKGAAGPDGESCEAVVERARQLLPKLRHELLKGNYQPGDIRRVWIPKPGGGERGLGIPNVMDRWVQQCLLQVLEPVFEPTFHPSSHAFRPGCGAHTAIAEAQGYVAEGFGVAIDIDLSKFFDRVHHERLLSRVAQRTKDKRLLKLVSRMLKAKVVMPDKTRVSTEEGTPQGGPLSALLSNIVLDELDWELARRGLRFVRYADDCNIFVRSERSGHRVMAATRRFIEGRLRLVVNDAKSRVTRSHNTGFLGFRLVKLSGGRADVRLSERSQKRLWTRVRELTPRTWGQSLSACIEELNVYFQGWRGYFGICSKQENGFLQKVEGHARRRLRAIIIHQKKRARFLFRHLIQRGVRRREAGMTAFSGRGLWRRSALTGIQQAYDNAWFAERLVSLL